MRVWPIFLYAPHTPNAHRSLAAPATLRLGALLCVLMINAVAADPSAPRQDAMGARADRSDAERQTLPSPTSPRTVLASPAETQREARSAAVFVAAHAGARKADNASSPQRNVHTSPSSPTAHVDHSLCGWTVRVDDRLLAPPHEALGKESLRFLEAKLFDIQSVAAPEPLEKLRAVSIVLDLDHGKMNTMGYHPSAGWLRANGYSTDLAKCVHLPVAAQLATPRNIIEQPWVILHELAHAYHDQVLGFDEPRILEAYEDFKQSGRGDQALRYDGARTRHYGLTDQKEFFAEMSESYFGLNDFFPFNRAELMTAEPAIYELMRTIWGPVAGAPNR